MFLGGRSRLFQSLSSSFCHLMISFRFSSFVFVFPQITQIIGQKLTLKLDEFYTYQTPTNLKCCLSPNKENKTFSIISLKILDQLHRGSLCSILMGFCWDADTFLSTRNGLTSAGSFFRAS